jgi:hypothetical protein
MYIKVSGSNTIYPYSINDLRRDNNNITFPSNLSNVDSDVLANYYTYRVIVVPVDTTDYTKNYEEGTPIQSGSVYVQNWLITSASVEEITERENIQWDEIRDERNRLLTECDWTQFQDTPISGSKLTEWQAYRQSLRDITNQSNPFEIIWPVKPE